MESYQFYKSIYDRELSRRKDLDAAINLPLTIITIVVAANSYIAKEGLDTTCSTRNLLLKTLIAIVLVSISIAVFFLTKSYNNFFKGFAYRNLGMTTAIRKYENDVEAYNLKIEAGKKALFSDEIIKKIVAITDDNIVFNDNRSYSLYLAKTFVILSVISTSISFIIFSLKYLTI